jgi:hypothetical protein
MGGSIISGSVHHPFRHRHSVGLYDSTVADLSVFSFLLSDFMWLAVCILVMQRPGDTLNALYHFDATF